jgi:serine/threonine protein kinase
LENILIADKDKEKLLVKIVDFGVAGLCAGVNREKTEAGSLKYIPPEVISKLDEDANPA